MEPAFQSCRTSPRDAASEVQGLIAVLDEVQRQGVLVVDVPAGVPGLPRDSAEFSPATADTGPPEDVTLHPGYARVLAVIDAATRDLARLIAAGELEAVRRLGYALHVLPQFLWAPDEFSPEDYAFCLGVAAGSWELLSERTRDELRALVGSKLADAVLEHVRRNPRPW